MKIFKGTVLTIGVFDGVHVGHRKIIKVCVARSRKLGIDSVVLTFDPHPLKVLHSRSVVPSLISLDHRIRLIRELGVDITAVLNFTKAVAGLTPEQFVKKILVERFRVKEVCVGEDFRFAKSGKGDIDVLRRLGERYGFRVKAITHVRMGGRIVSSSLIRKTIIGGDLRRARRLLGRPVSVLGTVVRGANLARELGYPTANINPHHEVVPPSGVYAVLVNLGNRRLKGVLNIGVKPTFYSSRDLEPSIEVHIFDFNKKIYGKDIEVLFVKKIRPEVKFKSREALMKRIMKDTGIARRILNRAS